MTLIDAPPLTKPAPSQRLLPIELAIADYDRSRPLANGQVKPAGIALNVTNRYIGDFCIKPVYEAFDVAEMSFSWYVMARCRGEPVMALPIFPLRMPVLAYALVREDSPYHHPKDLIGKRICVPSYRYSVNLWLRGIFQDEYGLSPQDVHWITCDAEEGAGFSIPPGIKFSVNPGDGPPASYAEFLDRPALFLERGEADAIFVPEIPRSVVEGTSKLRRLFDDAQAETHAYVRRNGFMPTTHVMVVRQALSEREPWITENLLHAFREAQRKCEEFMFSDPKNLALPDTVFHIERHRAAYGGTVYTHGVPANRKVIETFVRYAHEQGYIPRRISVEELFQPHALSL